MNSSDNLRNLIKKAWKVLGGDEQKVRGIIRRDIVAHSSEMALLNGFGSLRLQMEQSNFDNVMDDELEKLKGKQKIEDNIVQEASALTKPLLITPFCAVRQYAAGHGGFHTGVLGHISPQFRWVYDCGSLTRWGKKILDESISDFICRNKSSRDTDPNVDCDINLLFISHFNSDHVSDIEKLIGKTENSAKVDTVVIPYLSPEDKFVILLRDAATKPRLSADMAGIIYDPVGHFSRRGVRRLIRVRPSPPEVAESDPSAPIRDNSSRSAVVTEPLRPGTGAHYTLIASRADASRWDVDPISGMEVLDLPHGSKIVITQDTTITDWYFRPYAYEWRENHQAIHAAAMELVGCYPEDRDFQDRLISKLRERPSLFKEVFSGMKSNVTSLSLYIGPAPRLGNGRIVYGGPRDKMTGWLLSGDSNLKNVAQFQAWKAYYSQEAETIGHLMIPHHGSQYNFRDSLFDFGSNTRYFFTADTDRKVLRDRLTKLKKQLSIVSDQTEVEFSGPSELEADWSEKLKLW